MIQEIDSEIAKADCLTFRGKIYRIFGVSDVVLNFDALQSIALFIKTAGTFDGG